MAFSFNIEAAIDAIATLEGAISTPTPGVTTAYGFGENPTEITNPALLPAVVHISRGPQTVGGGDLLGAFTYGSYRLAYEIDSLLLILEIVQDQYPADEAASAKFFDSVCDTFFNDTNISSLISSAGVDSYTCGFPRQPSYLPIQWPPYPSEPLHWYWGLRYTHRFVFDG